MLNTIIVASAKVIGFLLVAICSIVSFYAAVHAIDINSQMDLFFAGLLGLLLGVVAGPLYCFISYYGLNHYLAFTPLGAVLLLIPVLLAWCVLAFNTVTGLFKG